MGVNNRSSQKFHIEYEYNYFFDNLGNSFGVGKKGCEIDNRM